MNSECLSHYAFKQIDADDAEVIEYISNQEGFDVEYRQLTTGNFRGEIAAAMFNDTLVFRERHSQSVSISGAAPIDDFEFAIPLGNSEVHRYQGMQPGPSDVIVVKPGISFDFVSSSNMDLVYIQLPQERVHALGTAAGTDVNNLDQYLLRAEPNVINRFKYVLSTATEPLSQSDPELLEAQSIDIEQQLLWTLTDLLSTMDSIKPSPSQFQSPKATPAIAKRVRDRMEDSLEDPLKMIDICEELDCRLRTLQRAFSRYFGVAPIAYHKRIRMNAARRSLLDADPDVTSVTHIATDYGFWHLGRFAVDYRQMFGELPSRTLASVKRRHNYSSLR